jgi:hypothetical protein
LARQNDLSDVMYHGLMIEYNINEVTEKGWRLWWRLKRKKKLILPRLITRRWRANCFMLVIWFGRLVWLLGWRAISSAIGLIVRRTIEGDQGCLRDS